MKKAKRSNWGKEVRIFYANRTLTSYLRSIGFNYKHTGTIETKYYVNGIGSQVRINYDEGIIALLNSNGRVLESGKNVTKKRIDEFSKGIGCEYKKEKK